MLRKIRISQCIIILFIVAALFLIATGGIGLLNINSTQTSLGSLYHDRFLPSIYVAEVKSDFIKIRLDAVRAIYTGYKEEYATDVKKLHHEIDGYIAKYRKSKMDKEEKRMLDDIDNFHNNYIKIWEGIVSDLKTTKTVSQAMQDEFRKLGDDSLSRMDKLVQYNMTLAKNLNNSTDKSAVTDITIYIILVAASLLLLILISIPVIRKVADGFTAACNHLDVLAKGDFSIDIPERHLELGDEIGDMMKSVNTMQKSISNIIKGVIGESANVSSNIDIAGEHMKELTGQIEEVSATTEELSAGMEETAASTQEMNATSTEIEKAIESIAAKAQEGAESAGEISKRANDLKSNAVTSQKNANDVYAATQNRLKSAIDQSKAVEQINVLSDAILQITSQTNLLALNAAIEAARAGEAGRGFTVVADEIRKLAEESKRTVTEIQNITKTVVSAVENLAESSEQILDFIDSHVVRDYQSQVRTGEQYSKDAEYVADLVSDFSATSQELLAAIQNMMKAINEITTATNEGAGGVQNIAQKTIVVSEKANDVFKQTSGAKEGASKLLNMVTRFKV